jgi:hypothetical protein
MRQTYSWKYPDTLIVKNFSRGTGKRTSLLLIA